VKPLPHLENKTIFWLKTQMKNGTFDDLLKLWVSLARNVKCWKKITNQTHEDWKIIGDDLWNVEISQSTHQHLSDKQLSADTKKTHNASEEQLMSVAHLHHHHHHHHTLLHQSLVK